jgi:hypothetical protein
MFAFCGKGQKVPPAGYVNQTCLDKNMIFSPTFLLYLQYLVEEKVLLFARLQWSPFCNRGLQLINIIYCISGVRIWSTLS